jgi:hypothetical protein
MAYGKIDLTLKDIATFQRHLEFAAAEAVESSNTSASKEESSFYKQAIVEIDRWRTVTSRLKPRRHGFSKSDLHFLRGLLTEKNQGELARRCAATKSAGDPRYHQLEEELAHRDTLRSKLERPFILDRSQDAEPDDEDDEE